MRVLLTIKFKEKGLNLLSSPPFLARRTFCAQSSPYRRRTKAKIKKQKKESFFANVECGKNRSQLLLKKVVGWDEVSFLSVLSIKKRDVWKKWPLAAST